MDLQKYLDRIGLSKTTLVPNTLATLNLILLHHTTSIPFENIDVLLKRPIPLDIASVQRKIVDSNRGGYCFEHNTLLFHALTLLGFSLSPRLARVRWNAQSRKDVVPKTHLLYVIDNLEHKKWLVDCGGPPTQTCALPFELDTSFETPHDTRRVVQVGYSYFVQVLVGSSVWKDSIEFSEMDEVLPIDVEIANWWTSTNPNAVFANALIVILAMENGTRMWIQNGVFVLRKQHADVVETFPIGTQEELLNVLRNRFNLNLPVDTPEIGPCTAAWAKRSRIGE